MPDPALVVVDVDQLLRRRAPRHTSGRRGVNAHSGAHANNSDANVITRQPPYRELLDAETSRI
eukprot:7050347-Pyramimonas_sp.AAC.1